MLSFAYAIRKKRFVRLSPLNARPGDFAAAWTMKLGIVREVTGKQRRRIYAYSRYLEILNQGTDPLGAQT